MEKFAYRVGTIGLFVWSGPFSTVSAADPPQKSQSPNPAVLSALAKIPAAVSNIVDEKSFTMARQYVTEARKP